MTICTTSDQGNIFGLQWWNSQTQVDLTASGWASPCKSFSVAKATRQEWACYWGGFRIGGGQEVVYRRVRLFIALGIAPRMKIRGATFFTYGNQAAIEVSAAAQLILES